MKKIKVLILMLVIVLLVGVMPSCTTTADEITVTLTITAGEDEILDVDMKLSYKDPTVLMLVSEAAAVYEIPVTYNAENDSVKDIGEYTEHKDGDVDYFWEYYFNGVLPDNNTGGKANAQLLKDGDRVDYVYSSFDASTIKK